MWRLGQTGREISGTKRNSNKIFQPSWSISIFQFQQSFAILTIFKANASSILSRSFDRNKHFLDPLPREKNMKTMIEHHALYHLLGTEAFTMPQQTLRSQLFRVWRLGQIGLKIFISFLGRKCGASLTCRFCWCQQVSSLLVNLPWSN